MVEKILLISGSELNNGVGEQFTSAMIKKWPKQDIIRFVLSSSLGDGEKEVNGIYTIIRNTQNNSIPVASILNHYSYKKNLLEKHSETIKETVVNKKITTIWIVLNSDQIILNAASLINLNVKIVTHVWDTPEYISSSSRLGPFIKKNILNAFDTIMYRSDQIIAISDNMAKIYKEKYKKPATVMYFASNDNFISKDLSVKKNGEVIEVVFAGSLYAWREWNAFLLAIENHNKLTQKPLIKVTFLGSPSRWAKMPPWIQQNGHVSATEALLKVSKADVAYLPYWMSKKHADTVKMAFPSKMAFYCTASTPIFYHGPSNSNPTNFLTVNPIGVACDSVIESVIIEKLLSLVDKEFLSGYETFIKRTYLSFFHKDAPSDIFLKIMQCLRT
jgi:predicted house-cleaning noncanonical NTP pyrophosphatase (MazG superfamily)